MEDTAILWAQVRSLEELPVQGGQRADKNKEDIGGTELKPHLLP